MSAMPSPAQSDLYVGLLPVEPLAEPPPVRPTTLENEGSQNEQPSLHKRARRAIARFLIIFCIGVATTLAWQSYGDEAREMIANSYPQLGWLAPQAEPVAQNAPETIALVAPAAPSFDQQLIAISFDLDGVRQDIDKIAASIAAIQEQMSRSTDRIATEQIARSVAQLMAGQEQMTHEITKLQAVEQYVLYKNSDPPAAGSCASTQPRSAAVAGTDGALTATSDRQGRRSCAYRRPMVEDPRPPLATGPCA